MKKGKSKGCWALQGGFSGNLHLSPREELQDWNSGVAMQRALYFAIAPGCNAPQSLMNESGFDDTERLVLLQQNGRLQIKMVQPFFTMELKGKKVGNSGMICIVAALDHSMVTEPWTFPRGLLEGRVSQNLGQRLVWHCPFSKSRLPVRDSLRRMFGEIPYKVRDPDQKKKKNNKTFPLIL